MASRVAVQVAVNTQQHRIVILLASKLHSMRVKPNPVSGDLSVWSVLCQLLSHPVHSFIIGWNWKAAALSVVLRVPVYVGTTSRYGWRAVTLAAAVEALFSAAAAGVYAAFTEALRYAVPQVVVAAFLLLVLPAITMALDGAFHYVMHTPNLVAGMSVSLAVSIVSYAFNWYSMRQGTLLVGPKARSLASDIASLPLLIARFLLAPFLLLWRAMRFLSSSVVED